MIFVFKLFPAILGQHVCVLNTFISISDKLHCDQHIHSTKSLQLMLLWGKMYLSKLLGKGKWNTYISGLNNPLTTHSPHGTELKWTP